MRDFLLIAIVFSSIPFIFKRPYIGLLVFVWLAYMNPHRMTWGIAYNMPFSAIVALATFAGILFTRDIKKLPFGYFIITLWLVWFFWMNITTIFALEFDAAVYEWKRATKIQVMALLTIMLMQSKEKIIGLVAVITASVGFYGVKGGIFTIATAGNYMVWGPDGTYFSGNNAVAVAVLMVIPLIWFLRTQTNSALLRSMLLVSIFLCLASIVASYSRGAFLALAAVLFYFFLKSNKKLVIAPIVIVLCLAALPLMPEKYFDRLDTIRTYEEDRSAMGRINSWYFAYNVAKDNLITGGGFSVFTPRLFHKYAPDPEDFHDAHSIYFESLGEQGFIGLALFLSIGLAGLRMNTSTVKRCKGRQDLSWASGLASMLYVCLIGYASGGLFLGLAYFDLYYHLLGLTVLVRLEVDKAIQSEGGNPRLVSASDARGLRVSAI